MADQAKNVMIGLFVLAACSIIIFILLFLHPSVGNEGRVLHVRFSDIDKINVGTRVTFAGKPVGEVVEIRELEDVIKGRHPRDGNIYAYELTLRVDTGVNIYNSDEVSSRTSGLLGEKNVAIIPLSPTPGQKLRIINDEIIYATETGSVEDTLKEIRNFTSKFELALDNVTETFHNINHEKIVEKVSKITKNVSDITTALNKPEIWSEALDNMQELMSKGKATAINLDAITAKVRKGEGSAGRILVKDDLYLKLDAILNKGSVVMDDINHYGVLFHLDKNWQRLRSRRLNLMQTLSTPQQFRNFFNDEMNEILTSLSRVYMVLDESESLQRCCELMDNREYTKVLAELLRQVDALEENIRMYNQQVVDTDRSRQTSNGCCR